MGIEKLLDLFGELFLYFLPLVFGFVTLMLQTKNFEDEYDQKIKEISIIYDDRFEGKLNEYIDFRSKTQEDLEKFLEGRYEYVESLLSYANEYRRWTTMSVTTKSRIRYQSFTFLLSGTLLILSGYVPERTVAFFQFSGSVLFSIALLHMLHHYLVFRQKLDRKYNQLELRLTKNW